MRLKVHDWARLPEERLSRVYVASGDELPYPGRTFRSGDQLIVERRDDSSGCLWAPWRHPALATGQTIGEWLIGTSTLMERDEPYQLEVELARGCVFRLRNQLANWKHLGLESTAELDAIVADATGHFCRAATRRDDPAEAVGHAEQAILAAAEGSVMLTSVYSEQAMAVRQSTAQKLPTLLGVALNGEPPGESNPPLAGAFSSACLPCAWSDIEPTESKRRWKPADAKLTWAQRSGLRVLAGPLIDFCDQHIPDWAYLWEGDFETLSGLMIAHVEATVHRYRGRVQLWNVAGRVNRRRILGLTDEQRLQLVARAVRVVRQADPKTPVVVSFDQPWGEYLATEPSDLAPIDFADALERADLGIAGFGLELNVGYAPDGSSARNPLDYSRLLDYWSLRLELPLMLQLTVPSGAGADPLAKSRGQVSAAGVGDDGDDITPDYQAKWVEQTVAMLLAKNCVQVLIWNSHRDDQPHLHPHSGLVDSEGKAKPTLAALEAIRQAHLV